MALATYQNLLDSLQAFINRDDAETVAQLPTFVSLAEAQIRRKQEWFTEYYSLSTEGAGQPLTVSGSFEFPVYMRELIAAWNATAQFKNALTVVGPESWRDLAVTNNDAAGIPSVLVVSPMMGTFLTSMGLKAQLWPVPADTWAIDFEYIRDLPALSGTVVTQLFLRHPDLYLYGALIESAAFLQHDDRLPMWTARFNSVVDDINRERERAKFSASNKRVRLPRQF